MPTTEPEKPSGSFGDYFRKVGTAVAAPADPLVSAEKIGPPKRVELFAKGLIDRMAR